MKDKLLHLAPPITKTQAKLAEFFFVWRWHIQHVCAALNRISGTVSNMKKNPDEGKALQQLQTGVTWAFAPADLKELKASAAALNAAERPGMLH